MTKNTFILLNYFNKFFYGISKMYPHLYSDFLYSVLRLINQLEQTTKKIKINNLE